MFPLRVHGAEAQVRMALQGQAKGEFYLKLCCFHQGSPSIVPERSRAREVQQSVSRYRLCVLSTWMTIEATLLSSVFSKLLLVTIFPPFKSMQIFPPLRITVAFASTTAT